MKPVKTFTLMGRRWRLRFVNTLNTMWGYCAHDDRELVIAKDTKTEELALDTIIHECLHAANPSLSEDFVGTFATDVARLLTRLGYRKQ